jgi:hypothetical protein
MYPYKLIKIQAHNAYRCSTLDLGLATAKVLFEGMDAELGIGFSRTMEFSVLQRGRKKAGG